MDDQSEFEKHPGSHLADRPVVMRPLGTYTEEDRQRVFDIGTRRAARIAAREALRESGYRMAATLYVDGYSMREIAERVNKTPETVKGWLRRADVRQLIQELTARREEKVVANLAEAEVAGSKVLKELIENPEVPPGTRLKAINSALDRAAKRGRPVERQQKTEIHASAEDLQKELQRALADPAVKKWWVEQGQQGLLPAGEEVIEEHEVEYVEGDPERPEPPD